MLRIFVAVNIYYHFQIAGRGGRVKGAGHIDQCARVVRNALVLECAFFRVGRQRRASLDQALGGQVAARLAAFDVVRAGAVPRFYHAVSTKAVVHVHVDAGAQAVVAAFSGGYNS
jgi:hypothetical protein